MRRAKKWINDGGCSIIFAYFGDYQGKFPLHQFGMSNLESILIKDFLDSSQMSSNVENASPGNPRMKKLRSRPPNTLLTPGTYRRNKTKMLERERDLDDN